MGKRVNPAIIGLPTATGVSLDETRATAPGSLTRAAVRRA